MIIFLSDTDGDDVAVDARSIVAVTVGDLQRSGEQGVASGEKDPLATRHSSLSTPLRVTLVHTAAGPLVVSQSLEAVVDAWQGALRAADALAHLDRTSGEFRVVSGE